MTEIRAFKGFRYAAEFGSDVSALIAPPYDIISPAQQQALYKRNPHNVIRLEFGVEQPSDTKLNNRYTRSAADFAEWRSDLLLKQETAPALYVYRQTFKQGTKSLQRVSLIAQTRLEPWDAKVILPHEKTLPKAKNDRLQLLRACAANFSPIMALYDDSDKAIAMNLNAITELYPDSTATDDEKTFHELWVVTNADIVTRLSAHFRNKQLFIADGHHRYETALEYREEVRAKRLGLPPNDAANFVMMSLISTEDAGLVILPTHRLISGLSEKVLAQFLKKLPNYLTLTELPADCTPTALTQKLQKAAAANVPAMAAVTADAVYLAVPNSAGQEFLRKNFSLPAMQSLDAAAAQAIILGDSLGLTADDIAAGGLVTYTHSAADALKATRSGQVQLAVILSGARPQQLRDIAAAGELMPQKSTYFYPKLITGMVINPLW